MLKNLEISSRITSKFIENLYEPCLKESNRYDLMVCYLSPKVFREIYDGMRKFVKKEGSCFRLLISDDIKDPDILIEANKKTDSKEKYTFPLEAIADLKDDENLKNFLAWLLRDRILQIKIVFRKDGSLFHKKEGVFKDLEDNKVYHNGSQNLTIKGVTKNDETITTLKNWVDDTNDSFVGFSDEFNGLWSLPNGEDDKYRVLELSQLNEEDIVKELYKTRGIRPYPLNELEHELFLKDNNLDAIELPSEESLKKPKIPDYIEKREYQLEAVKILRDNKYKGLLEMATGSGKTWTAIMTALELYEKLKALKRRLIIVITCHDIYMCNQWEKDLVESGFKTFQYSSQSGHKGKIARKDSLEKKIDNFILANNEEINECLTIISTKNAASDEGFLSQYTLDAFEDNNCDILLVSDEAHHDGAKIWSKSLKESYKYRIALTATPKRLRDEEGDELIMSYFDGGHFVFDLKEAIKGEKYGGPPSLCKYFYYPKLSFVDIAEFNEIDEEGSNTKVDYNQFTSRTQEIYKLLEDDLRKIDDYKYTIIYTAPSRNYDTTKEKMRNDVKKPREKVIKKIDKDGHIKYANIDSETSWEDRDKSIERFREGEYDIIIAIKCLDQGIDIPAIKRAFILHSTGNPREYIQRRGRILRNKEGKKSAEIYDYILIRKTALNEDEDIAGEEKRKIKTEVERELLKIKEYSQHAENSQDSSSIISELEGILVKFDI